MADKRKLPAGLPREVIALLAKPINFHPKLARLCGSVTAGVMLSQAIYWTTTDDVQERDGWFYKSWRDWEKETCLGRREQDAAKAILRRNNFIETKIQRAPNGDRTLYFRVDWDAIFSALSAALNGATGCTEEGYGLPEKVQPLAALNGAVGCTDRGDVKGTKNTAEITQKNTAYSGSAEAPPDPRSQEIYSAIRKCWPKDCKCEISAADGAAIKRMLQQRHNWTVEELCISIVFRFWSDNINTTESVKAWIGAVTDYQSGPQDKYGAEKQTQFSRRQLREQARNFLWGTPIQAELASEPKKPSFALPAEMDANAGAVKFEYLRDFVKKRVSPHAFDTWFKPLRPLGVIEGRLYLIAPTPEFRHVSDKFHDLIAEANQAAQVVVIGGSEELANYNFTGKETA